MEFVIIHELIESNGKTIKENNLARSHKIALGTLVELKEYEDADEDYYNEQAGVRAFVVKHTRDCDGTPLYSLSMDPNHVKMSEIKLAGYNFGWSNGHGEENLVIIREPRVIDG